MAYVEMNKAGGMPKGTPYYQVCTSLTRNTITPGTAYSNIFPTTSNHRYELLIVPNGTITKMKFTDSYGAYNTFMGYKMDGSYEQIAITSGQKEINIGDYLFVRWFYNGAAAASRTIVFE